MMQVDPQISVIIPVYNAEKTIQKCVVSVMKQSFSKWEILLLDDGSTDQSGSICDLIGKNDSRIRVFHQSNCGVSYTRNRGLEQMKGDYFIFLDADDELHPNALYNLVEQAISVKADIVICGLEYRYSQKEKCVVLPGVGKEYYKNNEFLNEFWKLFSTHILHAIGTKLYSRKLLKDENIRFKDSFSICEDILFSIEMLKKATVLSCIEYPFYIYNMDANPNSLSKGYKINYFNNLLYLYENIADLFGKTVEEIADKDFDLCFLADVSPALQNEFNLPKKDWINIFSKVRIACNHPVFSQHQEILRTDLTIGKWILYSCMKQQKTYIVTFLLWVRFVIRILTGK